MQTQDEIVSIPKNWKAVTPQFFQRPAATVAAELLTCILLRKTKTGWIGGPICETEAYGEDDPASHTFRGKTDRNASMFESPGTLYVYRSYGIHWCMNISTGKKGRGEAVLIRALSATFGADKMVAGAAKSQAKLCAGPGRLCAALMIDHSFDGQMINEGDLALFQSSVREDFAIATGERIGISKALDLHWRFGIAGHPSLSRPFSAASPSKKKSSKIRPKEQPIKKKKAPRVE